MEKRYVLEKLEKVIREKNRCLNGIYISSFIPRKCWIATYTKDLTEAINLINPYCKAEIFALVKPEDKIGYPPEVKFEINQYETDSYIKAANRINRSSADVVILEHEFGLYGGEFGEYIPKFLELLKN